MKLYPTILFLLVLLSIFSCHPEKRGDNVVRKPSAAVKDTLVQKETVKAKEKPLLTATDPLKIFHKLYPIDMLKPESKDTFKKYGIEFSGICYSCDLAEIKVEKDLVQFVNVCDSNEIYQLRNFSYTANDSTLRIKTERSEFILRKVEKEPIFELKIIGEPFLLKNKRIAKFYTQDGLIGQFEVHDCGDFQG
ncbi:MULTISPECIES: hypothetical protein [Sphingobacterium]|uniref:Lipoprotein n=1 Tax=Sphingobacterium athyrii TaxID=2152717 RepID=A0A363NVT4_9SPHI|nr:MULTISPECIES: hypothetical protein [Sphingobacterium]PUV24828.1 hypothetical protein DCO56_07645 [Sphingobacterium athyrii]QIH35053.1 hypothetical protein G6053_20085 [Sphingobacterium sp. DR205]